MLFCQLFYFGADALNNVAFLWPCVLFGGHWQTAPAVQFLVAFAKDLSSFLSSDKLDTDIVLCVCWCPRDLDCSTGQPFTVSNQECFVFGGS